MLNALFCPFPFVFSLNTFLHVSQIPLGTLSSYGEMLAKSVANFFDPSMRLVDKLYFDFTRHTLQIVTFNLLLTYCLKAVIWYEILHWQYTGNDSKQYHFMTVVVIGNFKQRESVNKSCRIQCFCWNIILLSENSKRHNPQTITIASYGSIKVGWW